MRRTIIAITLLMLAAVAALPAAAPARHGGDAEVRARGTCGGAAKSELRVRARDGGLEVRVEVEHVRAGSRWSVRLVQEGTIAWRGNVRAGGGRFEIRRGLRDLAGADRIRLTARGPNGMTCRAAATLPGE